MEDGRGVFWLQLTCVEAIDDEFVKYLFQLVEQDPEDVENDPFHYPIIRMLVCLSLVHGTL